VSHPPRPSRQRRSGVGGQSRTAESHLR
jgi:hypothetical protein